jgi:hypothetical protein
MPEQLRRYVELAIRLRTLWCCLMHSAPMWPIGESYRCRICGCTYPVPWAAGRGVQPVESPLQRKRPIFEGGADPTKYTGKRSNTVRELMVMPATTLAGPNSQHIEEP